MLPFSAFEIMADFDNGQNSFVKLGYKGGFIVR